MSMDGNPYKSPNEAGEPVSKEADQEAPGEQRLTALSLGAVIGGLAGLLGGCVVAVIVILKTWPAAFWHPKGQFYVVVPFGLLILVWMMGLAAGAVVGGVVGMVKAILSWLRRATRGH